MKKRNKKYNPHKNLFNIKTPHLFAIKAASDKPLPQWEIERICDGIDSFIDAIKAGTCERKHLYFLVENVYLYVHLIAVLREQKTFSDDEIVNLLANAEFMQAEQFALTEFPALIDSIQARYDRIGKFVATGDELRIFEELRQKMYAIFGIVNQSQYVKAFRRSEPIIDAAVRGVNKKYHRRLIGA